MSVEVLPSVAHALFHLSGHVVGLVAFGGMLADVVGEEEQLEYCKDYEQFDENDRPQCAAESHVAETVGVQVEDAVEKARCTHVCCGLEGF